MAKAVTTGFEEAPVVEKKKRYSPVIEAIVKIDRLLGKLTTAEQEQVYLHFRNQFEPDLSFTKRTAP